MRRRRFGKLLALLLEQNRIRSSILTILTVCCSIPLEIPDTGPPAAPPTPLLVMALLTAVVLLAVTAPLLTTAESDGSETAASDVGGGAPAPGGTPNTDGELYWLTV